jgi:hypothetical protein
MVPSWSWRAVDELVSRVSWMLGQPKFKNIWFCTSLQYQALVIDAERARRISSEETPREAAQRAVADARTILGEILHTSSSRRAHASRQPESCVISRQTT